MELTVTAGGPEFHILKKHMLRPSTGWTDSKRVWMASSRREPIGTLQRVAGMCPDFWLLEVAKGTEREGSLPLELFPNRLCWKLGVRLDGPRPWPNSGFLSHYDTWWCQSAPLFKAGYFRIIFFGWCIRVFCSTFNFSSQESERSNTFHLCEAYSEAIYSVLRPVTSMFNPDGMRSSALK